VHGPHIYDNWQHLHEVDVVVVVVDVVDVVVVVVCGSDSSVSRPWAKMTIS
jgi:hypothetical protein